MTLEPLMADAVKWSHPSIYRFIECGYFCERRRRRDAGSLTGAAVDWGLCWQEFCVFCPLLAPLCPIVRGWQIAETKENHEEGENVSGTEKNNEHLCEHRTSFHVPPPTQAKTAVEWIHHFLCLMFCIELYILSNYIYLVIILKSETLM